MLFHPRKKKGVLWDLSRQESRNNTGISGQNHFTERQDNGISHTFFVFVFQLINALFAIASGAFVARFLGPEGKGVVSLMTSFCIVLSTIMSLSLEGGLCYHLSRDKGDLRRLLFIAVASAIALWTLSTVLILAFEKTLTSTFLRDLANYPFYPIVIFVGILILNRLLIGLLQGLQRFRMLSVPRAVTSFLLACSLVILHIGGRLSILNALLTYAFISGLSSFVYGSYLVHAASKTQPSSSEGAYKRVFTFSLKQHIGTVFREVNYRLDYLILVYFSSIEQLGVYSVAVGLSELLWHIPMAIGATTFPRIAERELDKGYRLANQTVRLTLILGVLAGAFFLIIGPSLIKIFFGIRFAGSIVPFLILVPGTVSMAIARVILTGLSGLGRPGYQSMNAAIGLPVSVGLILLLIGPYGITGVAIAKSAGYFITFIIGLIWLLKVTDTPLRKAVLPRKSDWQRVIQLLPTLRSRRGRE